MYVWEKSLLYRGFSTIYNFRKTLKVLGYITKGYGRCSADVMRNYNKRFICDYWQEKLIWASPLYVQIIFTVLNCILGMNFTNITFISCKMRTTSSGNSNPCGLQMSVFPVLVDWFGNPLGVRISSDSLWNGSIRISLKNLYVESSPT
jgi:hypothetical protein